MTRRRRRLGKHFNPTFRQSGFSGGRYRSPGTRYFPVRSIPLASRPAQRHGAGKSASDLSFNGNRTGMFPSCADSLQAIATSSAWRRSCPEIQSSLPVRTAARKDRIELTNRCCFGPPFFRNSSQENHGNGL